MKTAFVFIIQVGNCFVLYNGFYYLGIDKWYYNVLLCAIISTANDLACISDYKRGIKNESRIS